MKNLFNLPVQIIRDPSDLIALVILWPAWLLWIRIESSSYHHPPGKVAYAILGLASLATIATDCAPPYHVRTLVPYQGAIYTSWHGNIAMSDDGGQRWQSADSETLPSDILASLEQSVELPVVACPPENDQLCYRVAGEEIVEISEDGVKTWQVTWKIPSGRRAYMDRISDVKLCADTPNIGPFDLVVLEHGNSHSVVVAMGNQGVLVRSNGEDWKRIEVFQFSATPTPFRAQSLTEIPLVLYIEISIILMISILILIGFNAWGLTQILEIRRAWPTLLFGGFIFIPTTFSIYKLLTFTLFYPTEPFALSLLLAVIWTVISLTRKPKETRRPGRTSLRIAVDSFILGLMPFVLWTFGIIPWYEAALVLSIFLEILVIYLGIRRMMKTLHEDETVDTFPKTE